MKHNSVFTIDFWVLVNLKFYSVVGYACGNKTAGDESDKKFPETAGVTGFYAYIIIPSKDPENRELNTQIPSGHVSKMVASDLCSSGCADIN